MKPSPKFQAGDIIRYGKSKTPTYLYDLITDVNDADYRFIIYWDVPVTSALHPNGGTFDNIEAGHELYTDVFREEDDEV